jgi:hypothetical protein
MSRTAIVIAAAFAATLPAISVHAAARDRVFVASYGSDSNPCTFGSPCKTFQNAVDMVAAGGEVTAIDSAGFGTITISHAVTITSPAGVEAGIAAAAGGTAITINAGSTDNIILRGLTLDGANSADTAVQFNSGENLTVVGCSFSNYQGYAISFFPPTKENLVISNTNFMNNAFGAVFIGWAAATLDHVTISNSGDSVAFDGGNSPSSLTISNSSFAVVGDGLAVGGSAAGPELVTLSNVHFDQSITSIYVNSYATINMSGVVDSNSTNGLYGETEYPIAGVSIYTDHTNHIAVGGAAPTPVTWAFE